MAFDIYWRFKEHFGKDYCEDGWRLPESVRLKHILAIEGRITEGEEWTEIKDADIPWLEGIASGFSSESQFSSNHKDNEQYIADAIAVEYFIDLLKFNGPIEIRYKKGDSKSMERQAIIKALVVIASEEDDFPKMAVRKGDCSDGCMFYFDTFPEISECKLDLAEYDDITDEMREEFRPDKSSYNAINHKDAYMRPGPFCPGTGGYHLIKIADETEINHLLEMHWKEHYAQGRNLDIGSGKSKRRNK